MRKVQFTLLVAVVFVATFVPVWATSPPPRRYTREALPTGGTFLRHPVNGSEYYFVPAPAITERAENYGKGSGLYISSPQAGGKFLLTGTQFDFRDMLIHPVTQKLYAMIEWRHVRIGDHGDLIAQEKVTLATSDDGIHWKDVTPADSKKTSSMQVNMVGAKLAEDPDHPGRVCVIQANTYSFVLRALNDEHSQWERLPLNQWRATTRPDRKPQ